MMNFRENEDAVSPVIGVILMVAITVILAAVIAAFVFGMTGSVQTTKTVAVTAQINDEKYLVVTFQGGADAASVKNLTLTINDNWSGEINETSNPKISIGASITSASPIDVGKSHAVVVAHFKDGSSQVVLDRNF